MMTNDEAIKTLREDYCGNRIICELYPDQCNREDCEIWLAIKALVEQPIRVLETQPEVANDTNVPNNDCISRRAVLAALTDISYNHCKTEGEAIVIDTAKTLVTVMPSAQPESTRTFVELVVEYPDPEVCTYKEYKGKPYYSIKYIENGETYVGYGTYNPEVLSQYLKEYFISSAQPEQGDFVKQLHDMFDHIWNCEIDHPVFQDTVGDLMRAVIEAHYRAPQPEITPDGTLTVSIDADIASVGRILLSQTGTQRGGLYYKDAQPEETCDTCKHGYFGDGKCDYCRERFQSHYERRTDGRD